MRTQSIKNTRGFSLVELMVAMVLGLILLAGVVKVFIGNIQTFNTNSGVSRLQENARFVLSELARDLRMTGYRGCDSQGVKVVDLITINGDYLGFSESLMAFDAEADSWSSDSDRSLALGNLTATVDEDSDAIVIKTLGGDLIRLKDAVANDAVSMVVHGSPKVALTDYLFISDCRKGASVAVTSLTPGAAQITIGIGSGENLTTGLSADGVGFNPDSTYIQTIQTNSYFIAPTTKYTNNRGDNPLALWRKVNDQPAEELAVGVSELQILYGVTTNSDGIPNKYVTAAAAEFVPENVVSARIQVKTNSIDEVSEGLLDRIFTLTVRLRNRANT